MEDFNNHPRRLLMAYRHSGKSWITDVYVAWRLYRDPNFTCVIISATTENARDKSRFIRDILETHPLTAHLPNSDNHWQTNSFTVVRDKPNRTPSVRCTSILSSITGKHADLVIADDVEVSDNVETTEAREKIKRNVMELTSIADRLLFIGTPHHEDSIYEYLKHKNFEIMHRPVFREDGTPQMPELHDEEWIREKEQANTSGRWRSQYLLIPTRAAETLMKWEQVNITTDELLSSRHETVKIGFHMPRPVFYIGEKRVVDIRAFWDPASGLKGRDNSVIAGVARADDGSVIVSDAEILPEVDIKNGTGFESQCEKVLEFCKRNHVSVVYVEKNFSITLSAELKKYARKINAKVIVRESVRTATQKKDMFIAQRIEPLVKVGKLYVHQRVLDKTPMKQEFQDFPGSKHDDVLDAIAGAINELINIPVKQRGDLIGGEGPRNHPVVSRVNTHREGAAA